ARDRTGRSGPDAPCSTRDRGGNVSFSRNEYQPKLVPVPQERHAEMPICASNQWPGVVLARRSEPERRSQVCAERVAESSGRSGGRGAGGLVDRHLPVAGRWVKETA